MVSEMSTEIKSVIRKHALLRVAKLFNVPIESLIPSTRFGADLKAGDRSFFKDNAFDEIDGDIRDAADRALQREMAKGVYEISTVGDYCDHMIRCYALRPRVVRKILELPPDASE